MYVNFRSLSRTLLLTGLVAGMGFAATSSYAQNDPPPGSARLAHIQGDVSVQPDNVDNWGQAENNMPLGPGDRIYTDRGQGQLQIGQIRTYFGANADLTLVNLTYQDVELGLAGGSAYMFSDGFGPGQSFSVQTPNGAVTASGRAGFRVDVYPDQQSTLITNEGSSGVIELNGAGGYQLALRPGQSVQLSGTNPVYSQFLEPAPYDEFAHWSLAFETHRQSSISARYVSKEMEGYDELDSSGDWQPESDYGPIWFPHVEADWAPYHNGHWVNRPFYGWTWVADEPWGAAPFHYGRWVQMRGRWGWIPGPREQHPVWSPAQVVFAGGVRVGGVGVSVWFPLGPGEAYKPWYPCSPQYVDRINITNIHESRVVHVQKTYINVVNVTNVTNVTYVNRTVGVTAMRQEDFAAGHSAKAVAVRVDPQQVEHVQLTRPEARPPAQPVILHPVAKPVAVQAARPVLINHQGQQAAAAPNAKPVVVPVKATPPAPKPIPGHTAIGTPSVGGKPAPAAPAPVAPKVAPQQHNPALDKPTPAPPTPAAPATAAPKVTPPPHNPALDRPIPAAPVSPAAPKTTPQPHNPALDRPAPAAPTPTAPKVTPQPHNPALDKPVPPAPAEKPAPRALPPTPKAAQPPPPVKPQPAPPEARPARPVEEKPAPAAKPDAKNDKKKDDKKTPPKKPE